MYGADCGNRDHVGDRITFSQRMVEALRVAKSDLSNQDPKFTSAFSMHFSQEVGMKLSFSTALHSQMDGKIKHVNDVLKQYLRNLVGVDQGDWANYVG